MDWSPPWRRKRLQIRLPFLIAGSGLAGGAVVLLAKWLYVHPSDPAVGSVLSLMADFVPMAIATVGIIMSYRTPKREHHLRTTLILVICGLLGTGVLSLARKRSESAHKTEMDGLNSRLQSVGDQNGRILDGILRRGETSTSSAITPAPVSESARRRNVLSLLQNEYILSHDGLSAALLSGTEQPPTDWINKRLRELGEKWTLSAPERPDVGIWVVTPESAAILVHNMSSVVLKDPKYSVTIWDLEMGKHDSLPTYSQPFKDQWLRPKGESGSAFGPWRIFETFPEPKKGDRLLGYARTTCPECIKERFYWIYTKYGEGGWYGELPADQGPDFQFIVSLLDQPKSQQDLMIDKLPVTERLPIQKAF